MTGQDAVVDVHLLQFPVQLWGRAREHSDALQREFALMSMSSSGASAGGDRPVPVRLVELMNRLRAQYSTTTAAPEALLEASLEQGREVVDDLVYTVPVAAGEASAQVRATFDEADEFCRQGKHLLTLETPDELVAFRHWYLDEFIRQLAGEVPRPWPG
jgi:hypothetical protein